MLDEKPTKISSMTEDDLKKAFVSSWEEVMNMDEENQHEILSVMKSFRQLANQKRRINILFALNIMLLQVTIESGINKDSVNNALGINLNFPVH